MSTLLQTFERILCTPLVYKLCCDKYKYVLFSQRGGWVFMCDVDKLEQSIKTILDDLTQKNFQCLSRHLDDMFSHAYIDGSPKFLQTKDFATFPILQQRKDIDKVLNVMKSYDTSCQVVCVFMLCDQRGLNIYYESVTVPASIISRKFIHTGTRLDTQAQVMYFRLFSKYISSVDGAIEVVKQILQEHASTTCQTCYKEATLKCPKCHLYYCNQSCKDKHIHHAEQCKMLKIIHDMCKDNTVK